MTNLTRQYGQANPQLTGTVLGLQNGDNITAVFSTAATPASPVGSYAITATLNDPNGKLGNYTVTINQGTLTVTPAPLTISANSFTRAYGTNNPPFTGTVTGVQNSDGVTATYSTTATASSPAGTYPIIPTPVDPNNKLGNYSVTLVNGTLTVTQLNLIITANNATKILNAALPSFTASYSGFVNGDGPSSLTGTLSCTTNATASSPVGTYTITCSGQSSTSYNLIYKSGILTIIYQPGGTCDGDMGHVILQPINADGTSVWKQGRTIPAKFRVCDANGVSMGTPGLVSSFNLIQIIAGTVTTVDETVSSTTPDTLFRWDPTGQQWIFNIATTNLPAGQTYVYTIILNDGSTIVFQYGLR